MGIFKKTIKYSKGSEDLNNKIKNLDEDLKKTGVISNSDDGKFQYLEETKEDNNLVIEEVKLQEEELYSWREVSKDHTEEEIEEFVEEIREKHRKLSLVENSIESLKIKFPQNSFILRFMHFLIVQYFSVPLKSCTCSVQHSSKRKFKLYSR